MLALVTSSSLLLPISWARIQDFPTSILSSTVPELLEFSRYQTIDHQLNEQLLYVSQNASCRVDVCVEGTGR